jgi:hypothetical protein
MLSIVKHYVMHSLVVFVCLVFLICRKKKTFKKNKKICL